MLFGLGILAGLVLPIQTSVNTNLKNRVGGSPFLASMLSFTIGTVALLLSTVISGQSLLFSTSLFTHQPMWIWLGGVFGVIGLTTNVLIFPYLGAVQTVIMPIAGQIIMGMIIDNFGLFDAEYHGFTLLRLLGVILLIVGILMVVMDRKNGDQSDKAKQLPWQILGIVAGMFQASQAPVNGHLGVVLNSPIHAAFISFLVGTIILFIITGCVDHSYKKTFDAIGSGNPWWIWLGGVLGAIFVLTNAFLSPQIGAGTTIVLVLLGNLFGSILVDKYGLLNSPKKPVGAMKYIGLIVMLIAVSIIKLY
ncbi:DMT family transporter [Apilactobacillus apinorum]|uniref:DMT family transporter n=1 Tax=Apilactobacillus apinorum TaxID=1218495 RepID=A0ABP9ZHI4_9LACO